VNQQDKAKGVVDIVFVIDVSGSMQESINDLAANIATFVDSLVHPADANDAAPVKDWRAKVFAYRDVLDSKAEAFVDNPFVRDALALGVTNLSQRSMPCSRSPQWEQPTAMRPKMPASGGTGALRPEWQYSSRTPPVTCPCRFRKRKVARCWICSTF
jgi:hypothetical protein